MRHNPERLAWAVLLTSFFICIGLTAATPLGIRRYVQYARVPQRVTLEVQQGPLRVTVAGRGAPVAIDQDRYEIPAHTIVATDATAGRLAVHTPLEDGPIIATVQLYGNTEVVLPAARSPRFASSPLPHEVILEVRAGRVRINVVNEENRPTVVEAQTFHGTVRLAEGSYEVKVNGENMEITVRNGLARVISDDQVISTLGPAERAFVTDEQTVVPQSAARNLITNGDFQSPLSPADGWTSYSQQTDPEQPEGSARSVTNAGRNAVEFFRDGSNHAEVGIRQEINYDVRDFSYLQMHLDVRIIDQNIAGFGGCGYLGTECPVIVRLDYKDIYGTDREWLHGFYRGEPASDWLINWWAEELQSPNWQTYDSDNLMEELATTPPALIQSLTIYASGHSFHALVTEVELLAQE
jgi:hypothetical protein